MIQAFIILAFMFLVMAIVLGHIACNSFNDDDPDMQWYNEFAPPPKPYYSNQLPAVKPPCKHLGKKSTVTEWTAINCEKTYTYCLECFERIDDGQLDCR